MTTFAQREQLMLAAKAAGYLIGVTDDGVMHLCRERDDGFPEPERVWNPLDDDGDAFRLASQLGIKIDFNGSVGHRRLKSAIAWTCTGPDAATTRRCIVYIAAQLAQLPPEPKPEPIKMRDIEALQPRLDEIQAMVEQERQKRRDDIISMAREAGAYIRSDEDDPIDGEDMDVFEFAEMVAGAERQRPQADIERWKAEGAAVERESCAQEADAYATHSREALKIAASIRARRAS